MKTNIKDYECPKCKGKDFIVSVFYQTTHDYKVLPNGKLSKKYTVKRDMPMETDCLYCTNCGESIDWWGTNSEGVVEVEE